MRTFNFVFMAVMLGFIHEAKAETQCGWIGAQVRPMTRAVAISLGMAVPHGAILSNRWLAARRRARESKLAM